MMMMPGWSIDDAHAVYMMLLYVVVVSCSIVVVDVYYDVVCGDGACDVNVMSREWQRAAAMMITNYVIVA